MIRILIRQMMDSRHRAPKSLGIADIEPALDPSSVAPLQRVDLSATGALRPRQPPCPGELRRVDLPLFGGQEASDLSVRIYHAPPDDARVRFETRVPVAGGLRRTTGKCCGMG